MVRNSLRFTSRAHWPAITKELRQVYTAPNEDAAQALFAEFEEKWGQQYPAMTVLWRKNWERFAAFLKFPPGVRKIVYTTNMIESLNSRFRQASRRRGHFPSEDAALKVLYLARPAPRAEQAQPDRQDPQLESRHQRPRRLLRRPRRPRRTPRHHQRVTEPT
jgi:transposase-like protein